MGATEEHDKQGWDLAGFPSHSGIISPQIIIKNTIHSYELKAI